MVSGVVRNVRTWFSGGRTEPCMIRLRLFRTTVPFIAACVLVAGCAALPEPDGLEAAIIEKAEGLAALTPADGGGGKSAARNGLLLSPSVRESAGLVSASADEVRVQRAALFPGLALTMVGGAGDAGSGDPALELQASQLLFDGGNSRRAVKLADFDLQIDYITFQKTVDEVLIDLLAAYDAVQLQGDLLEIYGNQLTALSELEALVARRVDSGAASSTDLLETRKRVQSAAFLVTDTELALAEARDRLVLLTGQSRGGQVRIRPASCKAAGETDDLRIARLELARAQLALEKAEKARVPRISLKPVIRGEIGAGRLPAGVDVDIRSDLLEGGALQARANAARNALSASRAKLENAGLEDSLNERRLLRSLATGERKSEMLQRQIGLLSETRKLYRSQYFDMGTRQLSELLDNEEEYYGRQAELAELRSELALDRLNCAVRSRVLRRELGLEGSSIYGFPLSAGSI
ncbi:outer membrane protein, adhesin transport system [Lutimaribacter pacificus]|uniref:Outer membrane protein, adhesin transport system n=2 Tax=Lutimaribacter pacificus TaxID=391948 RepID=A0A1H0N8H1_9RHOB|nr:outer membrane protein, adhesin transport system [Lutimaribacter pacificus]SHK85978.1 outer membrane protein, adhesin transport system [Lutimaribacter pacificus]